MRQKGHVTKEIPPSASRDNFPRNGPFVQQFGRVFDTSGSDCIGFLPVTLCIIRQTHIFSM